jgi:hypothetical protein
MISGCFAQALTAKALGHAHPLIIEEQWILFAKPLRKCIGQSESTEKW